MVKNSIISFFEKNSDLGAVRNYCTQNRTRCIEISGIMTGKAQ